MNGHGAWVRLWYVWALPGVLVAANAVWLFGFHGVAVGGAAYLSRSLEQQEGTVGRLETQRRALSSTVHDLESLKANLAALRDDELGNMSERLVPFLVDVVTRTKEAGLEPERIAYQAKEEERSGIVHFFATYGLKGNYNQIRQVVYLLEDSPQFVMVERVSLRGEEAATTLDVDVQLVVGTYFTEVDKQLLQQYGVTEVTRVAE